jgi:hypothetical protein
MTEYEQNIEIMKDLRNRIDAVLSTQPSVAKSNIPDPAKHKYISFVKSGFRILAGATLFFGEFAVAGVLIIVAEILGIAEEMV